MWIIRNLGKGQVFDESVHKFNFCSNFIFRTKKG
jgi:hypothetical protein